jgi:hypothetical protein
MRYIQPLCIGGGHCHWWEPAAHEVCVCACVRVQTRASAGRREVMASVPADHHMFPLSILELQLRVTRAYGEDRPKGLLSLQYG